MSERHYTFMLIPEKSGRLRRWSIPTWYLRIGAAGLAVLLFVALFIFVDYISLVSQLALSKRIQVENSQLQKELLNTQSRVDSLALTVDRLRSYASKMQVLTDLDSNEAKKLLGPNPLIEEGSDIFIEDTPIESPSSDQESSEQSSAEMQGKESQEANGGHVGEEELPQKPTKKIARNHLWKSDSEKTEKFSNKSWPQDALERASSVSKMASILDKAVQEEEKRFAQLFELVQEKAQKLNYTPSILPADGWMSSGFGKRFHPVLKRRVFHNGLDIANYRGTPIKAPANGKIVIAGSRGNFGRAIKIDHGYGIVTKYGHLHKILVKRGDTVKRGQVIAKMGNSGMSTGVHLHYQVEVKGRPVNPKLFILDRDF